MNVEFAKNTLRNYRSCKENVKAYKEKLDILYYQLGGVKGLDPSKERFAISEQAKSENYFKISGEIDTYINLIGYCEKTIYWSEKILDLLSDEVREACLSIYVNKNTLNYTARKMYISSPALSKKINKALRKASI